MNIGFRRIDKDLPPPIREAGAAAFDLPCRLTVSIPPNRISLMPVNTVIKVPPGMCVLIAIRSSTPIRRGLVLANGVGVIDPFFSGLNDEIMLQLLNITDKPVTVERGECIAQALVITASDEPWEEVDSNHFADPHGTGYDVTVANRAIVT